MGYMKNLAIKIMNMKPVFCEQCSGNSLYILEEEGIMWCSTCGFIESVDEYEEKQYKIDDYIHLRNDEK